MNKILLIFLGLLPFTSLSQNELSSENHKVLGAQVEGFKVNIPFGQKLITAVWDDYSDFLGRSEPTADHQTYQAVFKEAIYPKEVLVFAQIKGNETNGSLWAGIDPQGIPKDTLEILQKELKTFVYDFNIKVRTHAAQKKIDQSEQAASYLSKEYEQLKREERRNSRSLERTNERIVKYEQELVELRNDSSAYVEQLSTLELKLDSLNTELEKVKGMVELYKVEMEAID